ncbi:MAG: hypothetical protein Q4G43_16000 [Mobilicoccus sp.]|nr:hypothetical protein [Mobilicoccus sp.]
MRITGVTTTVRDLDVASTFYSDILQLPTVGRDGAAEVTMGSTVLTLVENRHVERHDTVRHRGHGRDRRHPRRTPRAFAA